MDTENKIYFTCKQMEMMGLQVNHHQARFFYYMGSNDTWKKANRSIKREIGLQDKLKESLDKQIELIKKVRKLHEDKIYWMRKYIDASQELAEINNKKIREQNGEEEQEQAGDRH